MANSFKKLLSSEVFDSCLAIACRRRRPATEREFFIKEDQNCVRPVYPTAPERRTEPLRNLFKFPHFFTSVDLLSGSVFFTSQTCG